MFKAKYQTRHVVFEAAGCLVNYFEKIFINYKRNKIEMNQTILNVCKRIT